MKFLIILTLCLTLSNTSKIKSLLKADPVNSEAEVKPTASKPSVGKQTVGKKNNDFNKYEQINLALMENLKEDSKLYKKCTPTEWLKNNSTDIKTSGPKLKDSYTFLKKEILKALEHEKLKEQCGTSAGILAIQDYLKKNLMGTDKGPKKVEAPKSKTDAETQKSTPVPALPGLIPASTELNSKPTYADVVKGVKPSGDPTPPAANKALFMEIKYNLITDRKIKKNKSKAKTLLEPFAGILRSMSDFHKNLKITFTSPLFDRARFTLNCIKYENGVAKTKEDLQLTITNFTANYYKLLDKGLDEFIERVIAMFCDKDKNMVKALTHFETYTTETDKTKKYRALGDYFAYLVKACSI